MKYTSYGFKLQMDMERQAISQCTTQLNETENIYIFESSIFVSPQSFAILPHINRKSIIIYAKHKRNCMRISHHIFSSLSLNVLHK